MCGTYLGRYWGVISEMMYSQLARHADGNFAVSLKFHTPDPMFTVRNRHVLWCLLTSKAQLLFAWMVLTHRSLVVNDRRHQLLMADDRLLAVVLLPNIVSLVIMVPQEVSSSARTPQSPKAHSFPIIGVVDIGP